ncbi:MAG: hypothetical protein M3R48_01950 [Candidatus Dormibacteraeota bacterium]|nr:hypothetical protein [Candidatus Dormibacteraeota bacterium]
MPDDEWPDDETSILEQAHRGHVFDPLPMPEFYQYTHVAFDELLGGRDVEARLTTRAAAVGRVALIGKSGSGKTSAVRYALTENEEHTAAIWLQVGPEDPAVLSDVTRFGRHLVETIVHFATVEMTILSRQDAHLSLAEGAGQKYTKAGMKTTTQLSGGLRTPWMHADLAREFAQSQPDLDLEMTPARIKRVIEALLDRIADEGGNPIVVFDDSDRWLQAVGGEPERVTAFFGTLLPWLGEMRCGIVCAVDERYLEDGAWKRALDEGIIETTVSLPPLTDPSQFARILARRLEASQMPVPVQDLFDEEALVAMYELYVARGSGSIRAAVAAAHVAVQFAVERHAERVTGRDMRAAHEAPD